MTDKAVFPRSFLKAYPQAARAEGCFIYTADGRRYLDASGGAAVVTIGHGVEEISRAMAEQASRLAYVHSSQFQTAIAEKLAARILALAPRGMRQGWSRLFHFRRFRGHRDRAETRAAILDRARREETSPRAFAAAELSRQHAGSAFGLGQCAQARAVRADAEGMGAHPAVLLLSLPVRPALSGMQCGLRGRTGSRAGARRIEGRRRVSYSSRYPARRLGAVAPPEGYVQRIGRNLPPARNSADRG